MNREEAKAKVAKLMAMATHERGNEFEAEAAMRMAMSLMKKHAIDQAELADSTGKKTEFEWSTVLVPLNPQANSKVTIGWLGTLAVSVARFTDTKASYARAEPYGYCIKVEGEMMDVAYAVYLLKHLRDTIRGQSGRFNGTRMQREDFRRGMVTRIGERMEELRAKAEEEMRATPVGASGTAMVFVDQKIALRDKEFGAMKVGNRKVRGAGAYAYGQGTSAGDKVGFGRPVGQDSKRQLGNT